MAGNVRRSPSHGQYFGEESIVKILTIVCLLLIAVGSLTGCSTIALNDFDADMPEALVQEYLSAKTDYADEGLLWIPLILEIDGRVSVTKDGFHAEESGGIGPLGLLVSGSSSSDFDQEGRLTRYSSKAGTVWGLLLREDSYANREDGESLYRFRFLYGLFGYSKTSDYEKTYYLFYIPIPK